MTKEEVSVYADTITRTNNRTIISFKSGDKLTGFFDHNVDQKVRDTNQWNFVKTPIEDENNKFTLLNGEDFSGIEIITI